MVTQEQINRINELARKSKAEGLNEAEKEEQAKLRRIYIDSFKESLVGQLENTYIVDEKGNKKEDYEKKQMKKLIIIEGLDGSGKSTQVKLLEDYFTKNSIDYKR